MELHQGSTAWSPDGTAIASGPGMASVSNPIELMSNLGHEYRRIRNDHERESSNGSTRRRIEQQMGKIAGRFEKLLAHWVHDPAVSDEWREFFYHDSEQPDAPTLLSPPAFRGETSTGAIVEIQETESGIRCLPGRGPHRPP